MRIERLSADNRRTQGAERRAWYERYSAKHLREMERAVDAALAARASNTPDAAAILGAGACTELPLERLARACDPLTLVDLDAPGMGLARDSVPERLRAHIEIIAADLTGGASAALRAEISIQPWRDLRSLGGKALLDALADCLERAEVPELPDIVGMAPHSFGLVISSLTLTQLYSLPLLDALDVLLAYAPELAERRDEHPRYVAAARAFRRRVALAHLSLIALLLAPGGAALLATDKTGYLLSPRTGPHAREEREALATLPASALAWPTDLEAWFALVGPPREWAWMVAMPEGETPGRAYDVVAAVLRAWAE
ncbi:MAG TPA: hypothetical protein VF808_11755 [Ktedonobacterales bacterium]